MPETPPAFSPPLVVASLSGRADAAWAKAAAPFAGCAFLGGIALDDPTRAAARELRARDREEFLPEEPVEFIADQLATMEGVPMETGFNVRTTRLAPLRAAARVCREREAFIEINAHCRQDEMCARGAGEALLRESDRLYEQVRTAAEECPAVSVKLRTEVEGVDLPAVAEEAVDAGATVLHVDAMDSEPVVGEIAARVEATVVANNEVRDRQSAHEYLSYGADAVSVGRPSDDPRVLERVRDAVLEWEAESGRQVGERV